MVEPSPRKLHHTRRVTVEVFTRQDGLWELDAHLTDHRTHDFVLASGPRKAGDPVHSMTLNLVFNTTGEVLAARARTEAMPYPGYCDQYGNAYGQLVGLNFFKGFRAAVKERLGGIAGCTHITEMTQVLPTAVVQAFAGTVISTQQAGEAAPPPEKATKPFQLDHCHALRTDGPAVKLYYPRWYKPGASAGEPAALGAGEPA